ncbi:hypothetical protein [Paenibacillus solani]|uniref:hypothetical protein n=1 Tax=Paenibacillus solani TaxID=1705565 RepID=UPI003D2D3D55
MALWSDTPRISAPPNTQDIGQVLSYVKDLANTVAKMAKDLEFLVNGNLDANNIRANSIETKNLKANSITADKIQAGAITAEKIDVNELSAISANLGHITAGLIEAVQIFGSYISTNRYGYPRAVMSSDNDVFGVYKDANNNITMEADYGGAPAQIYTSQGMTKARISTLLGTMLIDAINQMEINVTNNGYLILPSFSRILGNGRNLGAELEDKALAGISTNPSGSHNHGIPDFTQFKDVNGVIHTFRAAGTHTHEQTN